MWSAIGQPRDYVGGDTRSTDSRGYEADLTANLTRQWRLAFNFSHTRTRESDLFTTIRAYHAANRATFAAQAARPVDTVAFTGARPTVGENLAAIDSQIVADTSTEGQSPRRHRENTANVFTNYRFEGGALAGVSVGLGAQYRGGAVVGYTAAGAPVVSSSYTLANAMLSYERRILGGRCRWRVQLNIDNLFDFDTPQPIDSGFDATGRLVALRMLMTPRRFALTQTVSF
jgi:outer membrane receptor for ferric coprogen and ferric-rhodotorulic acid